LIALLTVVKTGAIVLPGLVQLTPQIQKGLQDLANSYPSNLAISIHGGTVSSNVQEPYVIPLGANGDSSNPTIKNLIVIDTKTPFSLDQFNRYQTVAWLTVDSIVVGGQSSGQVQTYPLAQVGDFTLDRATVNGWLAAVNPYVGIIAPILGVFALIGIYLAYLVRLLYLFVLALVIWGLLSLLSVHRSYGEAYKLGLYAMTTALIVELFLAIFSSLVHFDGFPFMFSAITLVMIAANALEWRGEPEGYSVG
jgi:hypothetical protein